MAGNNSRSYNPEVWFPSSLFSINQLRAGWITLYYIGVIFMSIASIVLSYNYFVPSVFMVSKKVGAKIDHVVATC